VEIKKTTLTFYSFVTFLLFPQKYFTPKKVPPGEISSHCPPLNTPLKLMNIEYTEYVFGKNLVVLIVLNIPKKY